MSETIIPRRSVMFTLAAASLASACTNSSSPLIPFDGGSEDTGAKDDAAALNALLGVEYAAIVAYADAAPYLKKPDKTDPGVALAPVVLTIAEHFSSEHEDHAAALVTAVKAVGGTPIKASSVKFTLPKKFTASVANILKLAANAERRAAVVYNQTIADLSAATNRVLAAAISGDEAQHFAVLSALIQGLVSPGSNLDVSTADDVVPTSFLVDVGVGESLKDVKDFDVTA
jgi:hypothetical protein